MPTVAEQLHAAREARNLTIPQVADATKIRTDHVRALENGNFDAFPAPIYIRGSVKNYATLLKLDVPKILADLDIELKGTEKYAEPPPLMEESKTFLDHAMFWLSKVNAKVALVAGGILAAIILIWIVIAVVSHPHSSPPPNLPPAVYHPPSSGDTLPLPGK